MKESQMPSEPIRGTAVLAKGISVLRTIAEQQEPASFTALQKETGLPKGTLHRILQALTAENLVSRDKPNKTYKLGLDLLKLANSALSNVNLRNVAQEACRHLCKLTGETVNLIARDGLTAIIVDRFDTAKAVNSNESIGFHIHFHCAAAGKAIAAFLSDDELELALSQSKLEKFTPKTITSRAKLNRHLEGVRRQGFAINDGETDASVFGIAAPIFDLRNQVVGSINLTVPQYRRKPDNGEHQIRAVLDAAEKISQDMGHVV